jgi:adenine-specific DNA-methyltransferase
VLVPIPAMGVFAFAVGSLRESPETMPTLHWLSRDQDLTASSRVPYRLLEAVPELSYGDAATENMLIQGDNLDALKALLPVYAGRVKCIFIDPPYNTRSAFEHYDDNLEHAQWLSMMYPRLELLRDLLSPDGSIWVTIDDNEAHYLKVIMDEVFGRQNFVANVVWQKRTSRENRKAIGSSNDHVFVYARSGPGDWKRVRNLLPDSAKGFSNPDNDPNGRWRSIPFSAQGFRQNQMYTIETPAGNMLKPPKGRCWGATEPEYKRLLSEGRVYFPKKGTGRPRTKKYEWEESGLAPNTWWPASDFGDNEAAKKESLELFKDGEAFGTPKPEKLLKQILVIATNEGDCVLDSFLGSGTTCAVALKSNRRFIGIEAGDQAETYCVPRLKQVVDGEQGGISEAVSWKGGGGFRFFRLGSAVFDEHGNINPKIKFAHLAAHVWFTETLTPLPKVRRSPLLGVHAGVALYLLYNGILHDRRPESGNVLTRAVLDALEPHDGPRTIYGESSRLSPATLKRLNITFKQTPYDVRAR